MNGLRWIIGLLIGIAFVAIIYRQHRPFLVQTDPELHATQPVLRIETPITPIAFLGKASCSGIACHGNAKLVLDDSASTEPRWQSSYTHWESFDPHRNAYRSLQTPSAKSIFQRLTRPDEVTSSLPETDQRCLACHTTPTLAIDQPKGIEKSILPLLRSEGVSCEACHGSASQWLGEHTKWTSPESRSQGLQKTGMVALNDPGQRAVACAGCHVGSSEDTKQGFPVRDMNHDMIAAGHPRLFFEYTAFLKRLPPHWLEKNRDLSDTPLRNSDDSAYAWFVGQLATTEAMLRLSSSRAQRSLTHPQDQAAAPWPEFSEFRCSACHQSIADSTASQRSKLTTGKLSRRFPLSASLSRQLQTMQPDPQFFKEWQRIQQDKASMDLSAWSQLLQTAEMLKGYRERLAKLPATFWKRAFSQWLLADPADHWQWEEYAARYYAVMHFAQAIAPLKSEAKAEIDKCIDALGQTLRFPATGDVIFTGPTGWDPRKSAECYRTLMTALKPIMVLE